MTQFSVNASRLNPYKDFKFRVKWNGRYVAGVSKVSGLERTMEVIKHRESRDPSTGRKSPRRIEYDAITLEHGVTHDAPFEDWANLVHKFQGDAVPKKFRKDILVDVFNEAGQKVTSYKVYRCWVSEYQALPDLDANVNAVAIEYMKLENEGWERLPRDRAARTCVLN
jgi:phage tail-like protein